ncbi:serine/threonine-protein kinase (plasmid) [Streptomyces sp. AM 4-1-1]|uniref:serine/threonine-protein kinase n=1 Tax=Streptomyces sp. AM 4-1-1 TaxID=3028710 RepID=UPI0023B9A240|nr:serine/threonine-protein kinase [Streptomyces sp. AM 4-1-1]WEH37789.1 serine/threonine-protein kinase [Streptomyces sp. AM 4-1-1]
MVRVSKQERLGDGGQGTVWRATRLDTNESVALKYPLDTLNMSEGSADRKRFVREVRYQSELRHAGIMPIVGMNMKANKPFFFMPLAKHSLEDLLKLGPLTEKETFMVMTEILTALEYSHEQGVLHRDLKPANLLYLQDRWVISDFGLCRQMNSNSSTITQVNTAVGSFAYMAPEQYDNAHEAKAPADIYSIGQIIYHCLVGDVPFPRARIAKLDVKYRHFIIRCVAEEPEDRFQSVSEVRREMELLIAPAEELATPTIRANELRSKALEGQEVAVPLLLRLIVDSSEDEVFYKEFVPSLPIEILERMYAKDPVTFEKMIRIFDEYSEGGHPFNYTDDIADFFDKVIQVAEYSGGLRRLSLKRVMTVGVSHNRFHVGVVFATMVKRCENNPADMRYIASLLSDDPRAAKFMGSYLRQHSLPQEIMRDI